MRLPTSGSGGPVDSESTEPLFAVQVAWDFDDSDHTIFTSHHPDFVGADESALVTTSTPTSYATNKLICTSVDFTALDVDTGDYIHNSTTDTWAKVVARDSSTQLSLTWDQFVSASPAE